MTEEQFKQFIEQDGVKCFKEPFVNKDEEGFIETGDNYMISFEYELFPLFLELFGIKNSSEMKEDGNVELEYFGDGFFLFKIITWVSFDFFWLKYFSSME